MTATGSSQITGLKYAIFAKLLRVLRVLYGVMSHEPYCCCITCLIYRKKPTWPSWSRSKPRPEKRCCTRRSWGRRSKRPPRPQKCQIKCVVRQYTCSTFNMCFDSVYREICCHILNLSLLNSFLVLREGLMTCFLIVWVLLKAKLLLDYISLTHFEQNLSEVCQHYHFNRSQNRSRQALTCPHQPPLKLLRKINLLLKRTQTPLIQKTSRTQANHKLKFREETLNRRW